MLSTKDDANNTFTCPGCNETYIKLESDADAFNDALERCMGDDFVLLCEICSSEFIEWKKNQKTGVN